MKENFNNCVASSCKIQKFISSLVQNSKIVILLSAFLDCDLDAVDCVLWWWLLFEDVDVVELLMAVVDASRAFFDLDKPECADVSSCSPLAWWFASYSPILFTVAVAAAADDEVVRLERRLHGYFLSSSVVVVVSWDRAVSNSVASKSSTVSSSFSSSSSSRLLFVSLLAWLVAVEWCSIDLRPVLLLLSAFKARDLAERSLVIDKLASELVDAVVVEVVVFFGFLGWVAAVAAVEVDVAKFRVSSMKLEEKKNYMKLMAIFLIGFAEHSIWISILKNLDLDARCDVAMSCLRM